MAYYFNWYCSWCDKYVRLIYLKEGDHYHQECGHLVTERPDPPYDHTGHDTLEEKQL